MLSLVTVSLFLTSEDQPSVQRPGPPPALVPADENAGPVEIPQQEATPWDHSFFFNPFGPGPEHAVKLLFRNSDRSSFLCQDVPVRACEELQQPLVGQEPADKDIESVEQAPTCSFFSHVLSIF